MKLIIQIILISILAYLAQFIGLWWMVFLAAGIGGLAIKTKGFTAFLAGFLGIALLWYLQGLFIDMANEAILSTRISQLFNLNSSVLLLVITAVLGGLCGGFGALTGRMLGRLFVKKEERHTVYS